MIKKVLFGAAAIAAISASMVSCQNGCCSGDVKLTSQSDSASYALGMMIGKQQAAGLEQAPGGKELNKEILTAAFMNALNGTEGKMSEDTAYQTIQAYFESAQAKEGEAAIAEGEKFLSENRSKAGVVTTESGLQYEIITEGTGEKPTIDSTVKCHYHGTLIDGTVFDSSVDRGEPATFPVNGVIPGWTEALQLMPVGSKWKLFINSELAYGNRAAGSIKPNSTLIFEVELLEILPAEEVK
ncbi:MAG: FKBP-type peptidyl-prolyl cis-trans isomerase [Mangrovibacterium sp.]